MLQNKITNVGQNAECRKTKSLMWGKMLSAANKKARAFQ